MRKAKAKAGRVLYGESSAAIHDDGTEVGRHQPVFLSSRTDGAEFAAVAAAVRAHGKQIGHADPSSHGMGAELRKGWLAAWAGPVLMTPEVLPRLPRSRVILRNAYVVLNDKVGARLRRDARQRGIVQFVSLPLLDHDAATKRLADILAGDLPEVADVAAAALGGMIPRTHGHELTDEEREALDDGTE